MSAGMGATRERARRLMDERATISKIHEQIVADVESRDDREFTDTEEAQVQGYRERQSAIDTELAELSTIMEREANAAKASEVIRARLAGQGVQGVESSPEGDISYRTMSAYARDVILSRAGNAYDQIVNMAGGDDARKRAKERLMMRTPANTLSSDVEGLQPEQHIAQIFQVIDTKRPLVNSAQRTTLQRGRLSFPKVTQRPIVAVQTAEKTEAGNQKMIVDMVESVASTYLGGGDLSWQTIEWSSPDALDLWFRLCAADYALKTEQDAGEVLQTAGFTYNLDTGLLDGTDTYADWIAAIVGGAAEVYDNSGRLSDTLYLAPDRFYAFAALQTSAPAQFVNGSIRLGAQGGEFAGLNVVVSRGLDAGVAIVGDSQGLLVAETAGAPVQLKVVEPSIAGVEVGIVGAFEAVVVDDGAFALITTAS